MKNTLFLALVLALTVSFLSVSTVKANLVTCSALLTNVNLCSIPSSNNGNSNGNNQNNGFSGSPFTIINTVQASVNRAPYFISPSANEFNIGVDQLLEFTAFASDLDLDIVGYSAFNLPSGATFHVDNRTFSWQPGVNQGGTYNITLRAFDGLVSVDRLVKIIVGGQSIGSTPGNTNTTNTTNIPPNSGPVFMNFNPPLTVREGQLYIYTPQIYSPNGAPIVYRLANGPAGLTVNLSLGTILWVPNFSQGRPEPYPVTVAASNGFFETYQNFSITVIDTGAPSGTTPTTNVQTVFIDREVPEKLGIYNVRVASERNGNVTVLWETNRPAISRVIYDSISQAEKARDFTYANATTEDLNLVIAHSVDIGKLELNKPYYFRAVSKTNGETAISGERIIIQLPDGSLNDLSLTAFFANFGGFMLGHPLFLLLLLVAAALLWVLYKRSKTV
ncbi:MAG: Ig domain-containing protein [Patescibacteria group bacterium]